MHCHHHYIATKLLNDRGVEVTQHLHELNPTEVLEASTTNELLNKMFIV